MSSVGVIGNGGNSPHAIFEQSLFNQISSGSGSITKSRLEQAVTSAGGSAQSADALFALLDPNNAGSVDEQQFSQHLPVPPCGDQMSAQMIGFQASGWPCSCGTGPGGQLAQSLFSRIDTNSDGSISKSELEHAVTSGSICGNTAQDALWALIKKFTCNPHQGNSAHNAIWWLLQSFNSCQTCNGSSGFNPLLSLLGGSTGGGFGFNPLLSLLGGGVSGGFGFNPLLSLLGGSSGGGALGLSMPGNPAENALFALMQGSSGNASNRNRNSSMAGTADSTDLAFAISLYQNQMNDQMFASMSGTTSTRF